MKRRLSIYSVIHLMIFLLSLVTDWYSTLAISLMICLIVQVLDRLGKGIVLREIVALHMTFVCLVMPVIGYAVFNRANKLARIFYQIHAGSGPCVFWLRLAGDRGFCALPLLADRHVRV